MGGYGVAGATPKRPLLLTSVRARALTRADRTRLWKDSASKHHQLYVPTAAASPRYAHLSTASRLPLPPRRLPHSPNASAGGRLQYVENLYALVFGSKGVR